MTDTSSSPQKSDQNIILKTIGNISTICGVVSASMIFISVLITCQMIWVRSVMNESTIWQTETITYLMISATIIGLPYVQKLRGHVNVDLLPLILPAPLQKLLTLFTLLLTLAVITIMAVYGFELFHTAFSRGWLSDTVWGVRLWIPYLAMPVGFSLFVLQLLADFWEVASDHDKMMVPHDAEELS